MIGSLTEDIKEYINGSVTDLSDRLSSIEAMIVNHTQSQLKCEFSQYN